MKTREDHFREIYEKTNAMLAVLAAEGDISARHSTVEALFSSLHEFDGGEWNNENTDRLFPRHIGCKDKLLEDI